MAEGEDASVADEDVGPGDLVVPFVFVPHGATMPLEWMTVHPGWVKFPAVLVPRSEGAAGWDVALRAPDAPEANAGSIGGIVEVAKTIVPAAETSVVDYDIAGSAVTALRSVDAVFADPGRVTGYSTEAAGQPAIVLAQVERDDRELPDRTPAEEQRVERFSFAHRRLRELEPENQALNSLSVPEHAPSEQWVESIEAELRAAIARRHAPITVREQSGLSMRDIVMPEGVRVGVQRGNANPNIRTVSLEEYEDIKSRLIRMAIGQEPPGRYAGTASYVLPDGTRFGIRLSGRNGETIDFDDPALPPNFKVHYDND